MRVTINGEPHELDGPVNIPALLEKLSVAQARVAVEVNRAVIPRSRHAETLVRDGDVVEVVTFVGGG